MEYNKKPNLTNRINSIRMSIASTETIRNWSSGEVTKPETINYKTYKSEKDGLFCEIIFGTTKDFRCPHCGKKHKRVDEGKRCQSCGDGIIHSSLVRRRRMGHIELATPISHIWFAKVDYSMIRLLLDLKQTTLDGIIYFKSHIVTDVGKLTILKKMDIINIQNGPKLYRKILKEILTLDNLSNEDKEEVQEKITNLESFAISEIGQDYGIDFYEYNWFIEKFSGAKITTGAKALEDLLGSVDIEAEKRDIKKLINTKKTKNKLFRRLKVVEAFINSKQNPQDMILNTVPIIPADLRPLIQLDGGRHSTADVNELYRRIIIRNNRLKQWISIEAPELIIQNEKRMLQESVDALLDNQRKKQPVMSKDGRALKSLSENLKGKQGRFRQNLLGKRVDYSGRSVIVVGPNLEINQVGIPREMIAKLFEPFIVNLLVKDGVAANVKRAKKLIEAKDDRIWKYAEEIIKERPVLLNRAPTLHRLSIQAFKPVIINDKAIRLHPLVTTPFNADFDGDQMAVYVPISEKAKREAFELMKSSKNILGPKDGKLIISPSQDMILGIYYLTMMNNQKQGKGLCFANMNDIEKALFNKTIHIHTPIIYSTKLIEKKIGKKYAEYPHLLTTPGRVIFNSIFPNEVPFLNDVSEESLKALPEKFLLKPGTDLKKAISKFETLFPFKKKNISQIIENIYPMFTDKIANILNDIKTLGFKYSTISGISMSIGDILEIQGKDKIIKKGEEKVHKLQEVFNLGMTTDDERYLQVIDVWSKVKEEIQEKLNETLSKEVNNPLFIMMDSGARGNLSNFVQLTGMRGLMSKAIHAYAALIRQNILVRATEEIPIKSSFKSGLSAFEFYLSTNGARKGLSDTATKTAESGYLTRRLVDAVQDIVVKEDDCGATSGFEVEDIKDVKLASVIEPLFDRIIGRYSNEIIKTKTGKVIIKKNEMITKEIANQVIDAGIEKVNIRSVLSCQTRRGICKKCYGMDLTNGKEVNIGEAVGIISAQSIGEPGTQLTMRTFHTGGVAGVTDITQGFSRLLELVDANRNPKSAAKIVKVDGTIKSIKKIEKGEKLKSVIEIIVENENEEHIHYCSPLDLIRVKEGQEVEAGQKLTDGSVRLHDLLEFAGVKKLQKYMIKEIQRLYRLQGIDIADKYMEVIIRQILSKVTIVKEGNTKFHTGEVVSIDRFKEANIEMLKQNKTLAFAKPMIIGVKPLPLQSDSFLAAASYQRTAESIVSAAINMKVDMLRGIKENLIVGKRIPVGTGYPNPQGKYDIFKDLKEEKDFDDKDDNVSFHEIEIAINSIIEEEIN